MPLIKGIKYRKLTKNKLPLYGNKIRQTPTIPSNKAIEPNASDKEPIINFLLIISTPDGSFVIIYPIYISLIKAGGKKMNS